MKVCRMKAKALLVCNQCDLLLRESEVEPGAKAQCGRCGAVLYRSQPNGLQISLIFALTAAALFVISNAFPIVTIRSDGLFNSTTLIGAASTLVRDGIPSIALLVFATTFLMPALQIAALVYLLLPLHFGRLPPGLNVAFRLVHLVKPWAMIEVFMMGLLVTITKLNAFASVTPDIALGAFALLMMALTAASANFNTHHFWKQVEMFKQGQVPA
jgi:paraquat-inducible protein A